MPSNTITQISRILTFVLFFVCSIQLVSSTPFGQSAPVVAVSNKNAEIKEVNANAALTSQNALTSLSVAIIVAAGRVLASFL